MTRHADKSAWNNRPVAAGSGRGAKVGGSAGTTPVVTHCVVKPWHHSGETVDPQSGAGRFAFDEAAWQAGQAPSPLQQGQGAEAVV